MQTKKREEQEMIIFWLALFVILLIIEIITVGLATIWFAGGSSPDCGSSRRPSLAAGNFIPCGIFCIVILYKTMGSKIFKPA